jgi:DNA-directed RNA polymerase
MSLIYRDFLLTKGHSHCNEVALKESQRIINSLLIIWEFLDRGMKGFLTGDITYHLMKNSKLILEKISGQLETLESEFAIIGLDVEYFYESFFKIDHRFYKNNRANNLVLDLSKYFESQGVHYKRLLYFVNIKHTQFFDLFKSKYVIHNKNTGDDGKLNEEEIRAHLNEKKNKVQQIFNDMYNELSDVGVVNKLKTPFYGIPHPQKENRHNLFRRQLMIEEGTFDRANEDFVKIFNSLQSIDKAHQLFFNKKMLTEWFGSLTTAIAEYQKLIIDSQEFNKKSSDFMKYFIALPSNEISILCLLHILKLIINNMSLKQDETKTEEKYLKVLNELAINEDDYEIDIPLVSFSEDLGKLFFTELRNTKIDKQFNNPNAKLYFKNLSANLINYEVSKKDKVKLGVLLTNILIRNIQFSKNPDDKDKLKVLKIIQKNVGPNKIQNFVAIDKDFVSNYYQDIQKTFSLNVQVKKSLPMIFPPLSWKNFSIGCHYLRQTPFSKIVPDHFEASSLYEKSDVSKVMKVLDTLSQVKWRINKKVLDLVEFTWATGGGKGYVPKRFNERIVTAAMINDAKKDFKERINLLKESQENRELHSLRCDFHLKMQIARDFSNCSEIFYPHNIDYRGRAYPISPHLNHLGSDLNRGLLEYAEAKPLGKNGLKWMKVHLANNIGKDKLPLDQREKFVDSIIDTVHRCAKDPYKNLEWLDSENCWQTIATMFEISNATLSSNPEKYKTNLHVHVDGSCNGLQHYSALGRDFRGGSEVNLVNRDRPGDVYTKVLEIVLDKIKNEKNPNDIKFAQMLQVEGLINRKVIKQTVMTSVYGVTLVGARDQIKKQLKEKEIFDPQTLFYVSMYLAKKTIESIGDLFREANQIKVWLTKCALIISQSGGTVKWITPIGLPCVQPYKKLTEHDLIKTHAQGVIVISNYDSQPVNKKKQGSAFPPNYIHSLDSSHMMLTCLKAAEK